MNDQNGVGPSAFIFTWLALKILKIYFVDCKAEKNHNDKKQFVQILLLFSRCPIQCFFHNYIHIIKLWIWNERMEIVILIIIRNKAIIQPCCFQLAEKTSIWTFFVDFSFSRCKLRNSVGTIMSREVLVRGGKYFHFEFQCLYISLMWQYYQK